MHPAGQHIIQHSYVGILAEDIDELWDSVVAVLIDKALGPLHEAGQSGLRPPGAHVAGSVILASLKFGKSFVGGQLDK